MKEVRVTNAQAAMCISNAASQFVTTLVRQQSTPRCMLLSNHELCHHTDDVTHW
jgi:hypothetical protein